jgi:hypothetical protein
MAKSVYERVKEWRAKPENKAKIAAQARRWRERHPDLHKQIQDRFQVTHADEIRARGAENARKRRAADPDGARRRSDAFKARFRAGQDAIAGRPRPAYCEECGGDSGGIVFDHCHQSGNFRGWLCDRCNKTLGMVKDDPDLLERLAAYLRRHTDGEANIPAKEVTSERRVRDPRQASLSLAG